MAGVDDGSAPRSAITTCARPSLLTSSSISARCRTGQRILAHASATITLNVYTHFFDEARHAREIRARTAASSLARLLEPGKAAPTGMVLTDARQAPQVITNSSLGTCASAAPPVRVPRAFLRQNRSSLTSCLVARGNCAPVQGDPETTQASRLKLAP
jgi:hypothetical protein